MTTGDRASPNPRRRYDAATRPRGPHGADRRPRRTAPTARAGPTAPVGRATRTSTRGSASTPTPATVWTAGPLPIDLHATWPSALLRKIISSFSEPGGQVALLPWPTPHHSEPHAQSAAGVTDHTLGARPDPDRAGALADALTVVADLGRAGWVQRVAADAATTGSTAPPFWADHVHGAGPAPATVPATGSDAHVVAAVEAPPATPNLIITSLRPEHSGDHRADLVALVAARLLRVGGILTVLTHCDWTSGALIDPTGSVVAAGQNADLLYLQHIIALHLPVRDGRFDAPADSRDAEEARSRHHTHARRLPVPHRRIHSDVLVFAQPHDHRPPPPQTRGTGVVR